MFWRRPAVLVPVVAVLLVGAAALLRQRAPELPGYRIATQPLVQRVVATGRVITTSRALVGSEVTATVVERRVKEGDRVRKGDVLVVLRADDLAANVRVAEAALLQLQTSARPQAQAALQQAEVRLAQAVRERERRVELAQKKLIAHEVLEQAEEAEALARAATDAARVAVQAVAADGPEERQLRERIAAARAQLGKTSIRAGSDGVVLTRNAEPGDLVQPGRVLFEIASDGATEIEVPVDEKNLAALALGQVASCIADAWPDRAFPATVSYLAPGVDADRGTVMIRLLVDPVPEWLLQDMTVTVNVETGRRDAATVVANDALLDMAGSPAVLLVRDGRVERTAVKLGLRGLGSSEVTEGLVNGDVVLAGAATAVIEQGARVRVAIEDGPAVDAGSGTRRELPVNFN